MNCSKDSKDPPATPGAASPACAKACSMRVASHRRRKVSCNEVASSSEAWGNLPANHTALWSPRSFPAFTACSKTASIKREHEAMADRPSEPRNCSVEPWRKFSKACCSFCTCSVRPGSKAPDSSLNNSCARGTAFARVPSSRSSAKFARPPSTGILEEVVKVRFVRPPGSAEDEHAVEYVGGAAEPAPTRLMRPPPSVPWFSSTDPVRDDNGGGASPK
mmetsp:Transcript_39118/g.113010  ORF Transcript_39118/g.113010 Transcript_39118/m.113010 type:complete len:219 (-) Transcript_39118:61-717(-)